MNVERQYAEALGLTHQMLEAARNQDWNALTEIEKQRSAIVEAIARTKALFTASEKAGVARIVAEMECENKEILERVQGWQKDARILLRMKEQPE